MFSSNLLKQVHQILIDMPRKANAILPILQLIMTEEHDLSKKVILEIAKLCGVSAFHIEGVISFYALNKKKTERIDCQVCTNVNCWLKGGEKIYFYLKENFSKKLQIQEIDCLGACSDAPVVSVQGLYYEKISIPKLQKILESPKIKLL